MKNILYGISIFTLLLMALSGFLLFTVAVYPFDYVKVVKETNLKSSYRSGDELDKTLSICKSIDSPLQITLELSNDDVVLLATKISYAEKGCKRYVISQNIPETVHTGVHTLRVTTCYKVLFRDICKTFVSDKFNITK